ncbi:MAG: helix-turn-helix transcriptional regulator [Clostridiales bacterium]|nr:helix-turn-helix transcriptional regulator [Clostridiales bacterium]
MDVKGYDLAVRQILWHTEFIYYVVKGQDKNMTVAEIIKQTRIESNMTQEQYGLKFGVTRQTVSSWENARSLPDLQMLIEICNTYHISLDKLLNEDKEFVDKIDYYNKCKKVVKKISVFFIIMLVLLAGVFIRWKIISTDRNESFANHARQMGFVLENGRYILKEDDVHFLLPNQKLPFLKEDFYVKNCYADFKIGDAEIGIDIYSDNTFTIEWNHNRFLKGKMDKNGEPMIEEITLNPKEHAIYEENIVKITEILQRTLKIHNVVYS